MLLFDCCSNALSLSPSNLAKSDGVEKSAELRSPQLSPLFPDFLTRYDAPNSIPA